LELVAPVRPGDEITAEVEVLELHPTKPIARIRTTITNGDGVVVLDGDAHVYRVTFDDPKPGPSAES
jgi:acyl dehydratase